jgi:hypothetical protein
MNRKCIFCLLLLTSSVGSVLAQDHSKIGPNSICQFHRAGDHFVGSCGSLFDQSPEMTLRGGGLQPGISHWPWRAYTAERGGR